MRRVVIVLVLVSLIITGCSVKKVDKLTDSERFAKEYGINNKNPFVYVEYTDVIDIIDNKKAILLFADSDDEKSQIAVKYIYKQAKKDKINKIYYYNPRVLKEKQFKKYKKLVNKLENKIEKYKFSLPTIYALEDGKIINYSDCFSKKNQIEEEYLTKKKIKEINDKYSNVLNFIKSE